MTAVIGLPLPYMLKMGAENKNCSLSVITCKINIATQEVTSAMMQILTTAGSRMMSGMVTPYAKGFFFVSCTTHHLCDPYFLMHFLYLLSVGHNPSLSAIYVKHDLIKVACHFLMNSPSIKCNERDFMLCDMNF